MIYSPKRPNRHYIDRKEKHGKCRFDCNKPTCRFCEYWKRRITDADCKKCKKDGRL